MIYCFCIFNFFALCASAIAVESTLVIGCRPWDANITHFSQKESAQFVDRWLGSNTVPNELPPTFHRVDLNDADKPDSNENSDIKIQKFSDFAKKHIDHFDNIVIHWLTEYMIDKKGPAWKNCFKILKDKGTLIVPVMTKMKNADANVEELINILKRLGFNIEKREFNENNRLEGRFNLLEQPPMACLTLDNWKKQVCDTFAPLIIVATQP